MSLLRNVAQQTLILTFVSLAAWAPAHGQQKGEGSGSVSGSSAIQGKVIAQYTGDALTEALVTLRETGAKTTTNRGGTFRFSGLQAGTYTVEITYLGYNDESIAVETMAGEVSSLAVTLNLTVYDAIDVVGTRGSQITSLNKQRAADNTINVIASDLAGKFPDATAAEALRRVPGVSFQRAERGGEGEFISIRGLDAGLNNVKINGMNSAAAQIGDRRVPLNVFQADAIAEIVVNKTLLPYHDGEGIGGAVELRTRSPLDLGDQVRVSLEGRDAALTDSTGSRVSVSASNVFGAEKNFGVFVSAGFRQRPLRTFQFDVLGDHLPVVLPLDANGDPIEDFSDLPADIAFSETDPFAIEDMRVNVFDDDRENTSVAAAFEWRPTDHTILSLNGTLNVQEILNTRSTVSFNQSDRYTDEDANGNLVSPDGRFFFRGSGPDLLVRGEVEDRKSTNGTLVFEGNTIVNDWTIKYTLGLARGKEEFPLSTEINFLLEDVDDLEGFVTPQGPTGHSYIGFDTTTNPNVPIPLLTALGYAALTNPSMLPIDSLDIFNRSIEEDRQSIGLDLDYDVGSKVLNKVRFGVKHDRLDRRSLDVDLFDDDDIFPDGTFGGGGGFMLSDTDLLSGDLIGFGGIDNPIPALPALLGFDREAVQAFGRNLVASLNGEIDGVNLDREAEENISAAYSMVKLDLTDRWQFLGGVRIERTETTVTPFQDIDLEFDDDSTLDPRTSADDLRVFRKGAPETSSDTHVLPRFLFNYRHSDSLIFRTGVFTALARPQFSALGATQEIDYSEEDSALSIELGNPEIEPAYSINFDIGIEYYSDQIGVLSANVFYKDIDNFLYDGEFSDFSMDSVAGLSLNQISGLEGIDIAAVDDISVSRPQDGNSAEVMGIELNYAQQFRSLPGAWNGLGVIANVTWQETEANVEVSDGFVRQVPFFNAPDQTGTLALTYSKHGIDGALSYSFQGEQIDSLEFYQVDEYEQPYKAVDLSLDYSLPWKGGEALTLYLRAVDLTNSGTRPINHETRGTSRRLLDDIEFIGRQVVLGIRGKL